MSKNSTPVWNHTLEDCACEFTLHPIIDNAPGDLQAIEILFQGTDPRCGVETDSARAFWNPKFGKHLTSKGWRSTGKIPHTEWAYGPTAHAIAYIGIDFEQGVYEVFIEDYDQWVVDGFYENTAEKLKPYLTEIQKQCNGKQ